MRARSRPIRPATGYLSEALHALLIATGVALPVAFADTPASSDPGKLVQCWTDDSGHRVCGDRVPPTDARRERELYDRRGVVKRVVPAQKSAEQIAAEEQARRENSVAAARDRFLLQTYRSPEEIERTRDDRLSALDGRLLLAQKNLTDSNAALEDLRKRAAAPEEGQSASALRDQIAAFERARSDNQSAIESIKAERAKTVTDFEQQATRFRELRALAAPRGE